MLQGHPVRIEVTSTLTQEDENRLAPAVLKAVSALLDVLPIAYMVRIETTDEQTLVHITPQTTPWNGLATGLDAVEASGGRLTTES